MAYPYFLLIYSFGLAFDRNTLARCLRHMITNNISCERRDADQDLRSSKVSARYRYWHMMCIISTAIITSVIASLRNWVGNRSKRRGRNQIWIHSARWMKWGEIWIDPQMKRSRSHLISSGIWNWLFQESLRWGMRRISWRNSTNRQDWRALNGLSQQKSCEGYQRAQRGLRKESFRLSRCCMSQRKDDRWTRGSSCIALYWVSIGEYMLSIQYTIWNRDARGRCA